MVAGYDAWLLKQADDYMESFCDGEPKVIGAYKEYEGTNEDGSIEYSTSYEYSCSECDETDCEHWKDFHEDEWAEMQAEQEEEDEDSEETTN